MWASVVSSWISRPLKSMRFTNHAIVVAVLLGLTSCRSGLAPAGKPFDPSSLGPAGETLRKYLEHVDPKESVVSDVEIEASIPNLSKKGQMQAERTVSPDGKVHYEMKSYTGDNTIKKDVIARYLSSEQETSEGHSIGISPANYRFKYKRKEQFLDRDAVVFELTPVKKALGLFKGELWLEETTGLPLRESGRLVRNPSVIFKTLDFTRDYLVKNGRSVLAKLESSADTRVIGKVLLLMQFKNPRTKKTDKAAEN
jgi:hypothetical protein